MQEPQPYERPARHRGAKKAARVPTGQQRHLRGGQDARAPMRQCLVCRTSGPTETLVQVAQAHATSSEGARCVAATAVEALGKTAWLCLTRACLVACAKRQPRTTATVWLNNLALLAERRLMQALGLARRQGDVVYGTERLQQFLHDPEVTRSGAVIFLAADAPSKVTTRMTARGAVGQMCSSSLSQAELGRSVGLLPVPALALKGGRHAKQAAYWAHVCYEARLDETRGIDDASGPKSK